MQNAEDAYLECLAICQQHHCNSKYHRDTMYNLALVYVKNENFVKSSELLKQLIDNHDIDDNIRNKCIKMYAYTNNMIK